MGNQISTLSSPVLPPVAMSETNHPPVLVDLTETPDEVEPQGSEVEKSQVVEVKQEILEEQDKPEKTEEQDASNTPCKNKKKKKIPLYKRPHTIPAVCFSRLVKEIAQTNHEDQYIWSSEAMQALQQCTEEYIEQRFRVCGKLTDLCKKQTLSKEIFDFTDTYLYQPVPAGFHD